MQKIIPTYWIFLFILYACEPTLEEPFEEFFIPEGKHSGGIHLQELQNTHLRFTAIFDESAIYQTETEVNQHDINKLLGFADCNSHHHQNSARFGWRWLNDSLEIHAYVYVSGERKTEKIGVVKLNQPYNYELSFTGNRYHFTLGDYPKVSFPRDSNCDYGIYYMLFPYFGGDEQAPHDISIKIKINY